jgi:2,4-dihydroxyhept-2-ene-1,7-dioic acid aldolase
MGWNETMELSRNVFKQALKQRRLQIGLWSSLASNIGAEIIADSGFDWILLDTEHSPNEVPNLLSQLQALERGTATPVIRPAWNDPVLIKRVLDIGTQSVLLPYVQNPDEARRAVAAVRYPPAGIRGVAATPRASRYGRVNDYLKKRTTRCVFWCRSRPGPHSISWKPSRRSKASTACSSGRPICPRRSATSATRSIRKRRRRSRARRSVSRRWARRREYSPATRMKQGDTSGGATRSWRSAPTPYCSPAPPTRLQRVQG